MDTPPDVTSTTDEVDDSPSGVNRRRAFFGAAAAVAVGAAVSSSDVAEAGVADGQPLTLGDNNIAQSDTVLRGPSFLVADGKSSGQLARSVDGVNSGVLGTTLSGARSRAVWGQDETVDGIGVYGGHARDNIGIGVLGESLNGVGVVARGTYSDADFNRTGSVRFTGSTDVGPASAGIPGTITRDPDGSIWYCTRNNTWQRLAAVGSAGAFTPITPTRVYDSREDAPAPGPILTGQSRLVSVAFARNPVGGAVTSAVVPSGATAVAYNVTVDRTNASGFLAVAPGDVNSTTASSVNWSGSGAIVANAGIVRIDGRLSVLVTCGGVGSTDFLLDVTGYYL